MITAKFDRPKLEKSLKRFAKDFGDTNAQAIARWGVQTCRELAGSTQVFGKTTQAKLKQWNSIEAGASTILSVVGSTERRKARTFRTVAEVSEWIDRNRDKKGRTRRVEVSERPFVTAELLDQTIRERRKLAGIAKGGWIGAGQDIARTQTGTDRIQIGKNFLGYAQKHSKFGSATKPKSGWKPTATLSNRARHSASKHVLRSFDGTLAVQWGLKKTISWYRSALRRQDKKQKS
jgi:hypothetical protein